MLEMPAEQRAELVLKYPRFLQVRGWLPFLPFCSSFLSLSIFVAALWPGCDAAALRRAGRPAHPARAAPLRLPLGPALRKLWCRTPACTRALLLLQTDVEAGLLPTFEYLQVGVVLGAA